MNLEYNLIFLSEAELELKWIIIRYNVHSEGLGNKVFDEVQKNLDYLKSMPFIRPEKYKNSRVLYTKRYKIAIHYVIFEETKTVLVYAFLHQKEDSTKNLNRII